MDFQYFLCGSISGLCTACLVQPFDVIKTNLLTIGRPMTIRKSFRYVYNSYGLSGFWRGVRPSAYKSFLGAGMTFYSIEWFKKTFPKSDSRITQVKNDSLVAILSRLVTSLVLSPLSVIKVRMEAPQANPYNNVIDGIVHIYKEEGIKGYYRGIGPALLRDMPFSALAYSFYNQYSSLFQMIFANHTVVSLFSGGLAGFTATLITQPFDIIKTRNQFAHVAGKNAIEYKNIIDAFRVIYKNEGLKGFVIGLNIRIVERTAAFATVWSCYETLKKIVEEKDGNNKST